MKKPSTWLSAGFFFFFFLGGWGGVGGLHYEWNNQIYFMYSVNLVFVKLVVVSM